MFYLTQHKLLATTRPQLLILFDYINLGLIVALAMRPFPKQFGLAFYLTALLGALLAVLLVLAPQYKPKRLVATGALLIALILCAIIGWQVLPWVSLLLAITAFLVLLPFIYPAQFKSRFVRLSLQFLLAPFFFLTTQIFNGIHFIPEHLLVQIALFLVIIYLIELTTHSRLLAVIGYCLWIIIIIAVMTTHFVHGWHLILFAGAQLLLFAHHLGLIKHSCYLQELCYLLLIVSIFN